MCVVNEKSNQERFSTVHPALCCEHLLFQNCTDRISSDTGVKKVDKINICLTYDFWKKTFLMSAEEMMPLKEDMRIDKAHRSNSL